MKNAGKLRSNAEQGGMQQKRAVLSVVRPSGAGKVCTLSVAAEVVRLMGQKRKVVVET